MRGSEVIRFKPLPGTGKYTGGLWWNLPHDKKLQDRRQVLWSAWGTDGDYGSGRILPANPVDGPILLYTEMFNANKLVIIHALPRVFMWDGMRKSPAGIGDDTAWLVSRKHPGSAHLKSAPWGGGPYRALSLKSYLPITQIHKNAGVQWTTACCLLGNG